MICTAAPEPVAHLRVRRCRQPRFYLLADLSVQIFPGFGPQSPPDDRPCAFLYENKVQHMWGVLPSTRAVIQANIFNRFVGLWACRQQWIQLVPLETTISLRFADLRVLDPRSVLREVVSDTDLCFYHGVCFYSTSTFLYAPKHWMVGKSSTCHGMQRFRSSPCNARCCVEELTTADRFRAPVSPSHQTLCLRVFSRSKNNPSGACRVLGAMFCHVASVKEHAHPDMIIFMSTSPQLPSLSGKSLLPSSS